MLTSFTPSRIKPASTATARRIENILAGDFVRDDDCPLTRNTYSKSGVNSRWRAGNHHRQDGDGGVARIIPCARDDFDEPMLTASTSDWWVNGHQARNAKAVASDAAVRQRQ